MIFFNAFGGMSILFPSIIRRIAAAGKELHLDFAREVREAIKANGGTLNMRALESMALVHSMVYEILGIDPPVPFQYGNAKHDMVLESHDGRYKVKKGEMLGGYQPFATRDPKVFDKPDEFLPRRFMGEEGEKLVKYLMWSMKIVNLHAPATTGYVSGPRLSFPGIANFSRNSDLYFFTGIISSPVVILPSPFRTLMFRTLSITKCLLFTPIIFSISWNLHVFFSSFSGCYQFQTYYFPEIFFLRSPLILEDYVKYYRLRSPVLLAPVLHNVFWITVWRI